jgi:rod shape-determining protein MreC
MIKKRFNFIIFLALFFGATYYSKTLQAPFIELSHTVKSSYHQIVKNISDTIDIHFNQAQTIASQKKEIEYLKQSHLISHQFASELNAIFKEYNSSMSIKPEIALVRTLSYSNFGDITKVWLDFPEFNSSKVYGLIYNELAAGIVIERQGKALALLNIDRKSAYAVFIGESKAPGIIHGNGVKELVVDYIPTYKEIKVGDEVTTSGLDELFFPGIKVGKVISIDKSEGYQNAIVKPYYDATNPQYFHIIKRVR